MKNKMNYAYVLLIVIGLVVFNILTTNNKTTNTVNLKKYSFYIDDVESESVPTKGSGYIFNKYECTNNAVVSWDNNTWSANVSNIVLKDVSCKLYFIKESEVIDADKIYTITLNYQNDNQDKVNIYEKYKNGWYSDEESTHEISQVIKPTKDNYTFNGFYTGVNGAGTKVIDNNGNILVNNDYFSENTQLYANYDVNVYKVALNGGSVDDDVNIYLKYGIDWYSDQNATNKINEVAPLSDKDNFRFGGYYTRNYGQGTQIIATSGRINEVDSNNNPINKAINSNTTLLANWYPNIYEIEFDNMDAHYEKRIWDSKKRPKAMYLVYGVGYFHSHGSYTSDNPARNTVNQPIPVPHMKDNEYTFKGYYSDTYCHGTKIVDQNGNIDPNLSRFFDEDSIIYACWE